MQQKTATPAALPPIHYPLTEVIDIGDTVLKLDSITLAQLATVPISGVADLIGILDGLSSRIKTAQTAVQQTLTARYSEQAKAQLLADGKDTGTTHILDGDIDVGVEIAKETKYEPKGLTELVAKIKANGGDPSEYVEIKYSVLESKFKAWPKTIRAPFEALRTVKPKAPKFVLRRVGANGEGK